MKNLQGSVAGGFVHTAVVLSDGTVRTFGRNTNGGLGINETGASSSRLTPVQVFGISSSATAVACGRYHTTVLLADGTVRAFGNNGDGRLGVNDNIDRLTPVQVFGISSSAVAVASGFYHNAVLLADGTVRTFGRGSTGQLGVNDTTSRLTPVQVFGISSSATAIACGRFYTAVLLTDGTVRTFGLNDYGELGVNDNIQRNTPVTVLNITSATAVACGSLHATVLLADGTVRTFGLNDNGQLGINVSGGTRQTPVQVFGISSSAVAVACGFYYTAVLLADGTVRTFGQNFGNLGVNDTTTRQTPVQVFGISSSATAVACGFANTTVLLADGSVRTFGSSGYGQLGLGDTTNRLTPVESITLPARTLAGSVGAGFYHTAVVLRDGTVRTFGRNTYGELGVGDTTSRLMPVQVIGLSTATAVAGGRYHTAVLLANGTIRTFGYNNIGQLGVNDITNRLTPVQVFGISSSAVAIASRFYHTAVLLVDGTVRTFGINGNGQLGVNDTTNRSTPVQVFGISSSASAVACGNRFTTVLLTDGTVRTFGQNAQGQLGVNDNTERSTPVQVWGISSSATAVACGFYHTAVLLADGTVRTFGFNGSGQLGVNDTTSRMTPVTVLNITSATAIACGRRDTVILLADGTVRTFGQNDSGQLGVNDTTDRSTPVQVFGISSSATAIATSGYYSIVVLADGTVRTFGNNAYGGLGLNDTTSRQTPVQVVAISATVSVTPAPTAFLTSAATSITLAASGGQIWTSSATGPARTTSVSIGCGWYNSAVILVDGTVRIFGKNNTGQLGVNDTTNRLTPVQVLNITSATAVAGGNLHTAVLLADGTVRTFGYNFFGLLGVDDTTQRLTPVQVFGISSSATAVACGQYHVAVLLADGTVRTFGSNDQGRLGINVAGGSRQTPVQVFGISSSATAIACGRYLSAVLLADGTVRTFGDNSRGQLGINVSGGTRQTPVQVFGISSSATAITCGYEHAAVLLADGTVRTFGRNDQGQLGVGDTTDRLTPVQVLNITSATAISSKHGFHNVILLADGTVRTFGYNAFGQLGVNDTTNRETPVQVFGISSSAIAIAAGYNHTIVLLANGTVRTFGQNGQGQLGVNDTVSRFTPVTVFGPLGVNTATYVTAKGLALGLSAPTFQLDLSTDKARKLSTTTWTTGSDRRIKSDIQSANLARCVDIVDSLDLKYFKWDIPGVPGPTDSHSLGWIAQDVKQFFPNSVRQTQDYGFDDFHNLDSDQLIKTMYGALKKMCEDTYGQ
jgi:alpha-tubulin suppressor-like RCC1 family protein